jgi:serine/threonine protein kinase
MLSRVNHKNFVNLIGYCEENKPFTRMMVFEYAPNGTLFEHLHSKSCFFQNLHSILIENDYVNFTKHLDIVLY